MKPAAFEYCRADSVGDVLELLGEFGPEAALMAGGMSLGAMLNMRLARPEAVIDINNVAELDSVAQGNGSVVTGALLRQADAMRTPELMQAVPLLAEAMPHIGHYQTRSRGTLGGSAAHADPSAEIPLCLATLDATIRLQSSGGVRDVAARDFFQGILYTDRRDDELLTALLWPTRKPRTGYAFEEIAQRLGDFAITSAAAVAELSGDGTIAALSLGLGGVEDRPVLADTANFIGAPANDETAKVVAEAAAGAVEPMEDLQANADYRRQLVRVLGARVLSRAFARAAEG